MNRFVNLGMIAHPINWMTLLMWIMFFGFVLHVFSPKLMGMYSTPPQRDSAT